MSMVIYHSRTGGLIWPAAFFFTFLFSSNVFASGDEFPSCDPEGTQITGEVSEAIHKQAQRMTDAACNASAIAAHAGPTLLTKAAATKINSSCERAQRWVQSDGRKQDLSGQGNKGSAECYLVEIEGDEFGNDDGSCSKDEKYRKNKGEEIFGCAVDPVEDINHNQVCDYDRSKGSGGRKIWEKCLQVCNAPVDNPNVIDCATLEHMHGSFKDVADNLEFANTLFEVHLATLSAMQSVVSDTADCR